MLKLIITIDEIDNDCVEYNLDTENENDATELEIVAANEMIDLMDDMIDIANEEDAKSTVKNILDNLGKQT